MIDVDQQRAIDEVMSGRNVFITGGAGSGKSVVIRELQKKLPKAIFVAPTGLAAMNIGGATINRTFMIPPTILSKSDYHVNKWLSGALRSSEVKTIVIDEISMVRADTFICLDQKLRRVFNHTKPFGGVQIVVVGDFYQLPPVITQSDENEYFRHYDSVFAFDTDSWRSLNIVPVVLKTIHRQSDEATVRALDCIRRGEVSEAVIKWINYRCANNEVSEDAITLCTTNKLASYINDHWFSEIDSPSFRYFAETEGDFRDEPVPQTLELKEGCRVIFCANGSTDSYVNGSQGTVCELSDDRIRVELDNGIEVDVQEHTWQRYEYRTTNGVLSCEIVGSYTQYPLKLGYAITVHKSQGMTLDDCAIDLGNGSFCCGQTYVALSRVRTFDKLELASELHRSDVMTDKDVERFYNELA